MKPAAFTYLAPRTRKEVVDLLDRYGDRAKLLAGGQTLVPMMNFRLVRPEFLIDLNRVHDLSYIKESNGVLAIGALTRHREIERSSLVQQLCPLAYQAVPHIAHTVIRNRGTIGGSLAHADPAAEWALVVTALNAELVLESSRGSRTVPAAEFFIAQLTTVMESDEILVEVRLPIAVGQYGVAFTEINRRHGDFALTSVAAQIRLAEDATLEQFTLAVGAVEQVPLNVSSYGEQFKGCRIEDDTFDGIEREIVAGIDPIFDIHASAEYRRDLVEALVPRVLKAAIARARGVA